MIPEKKKILEQLESARVTNPERNAGWVTHTVCVGNTAGKIAQALNDVGENYDVAKVVLLGYLHDIGKMVGSFEEHPINGYHFLKNEGYADEYCDVSLVHHYINNDEKCVFSTVPDPVRDKELIEFIRKHNFTPEEMLIILCDAMCLYQPMTLEKRIIDVLSRHGTNPRTSERIIRTMELKHQFDDKLGYNLYDLFPEIKEKL